MLPNFVKFYKQCIAPEVVRNNIGRNMKCVDPPYIREATDALKEKQHRTLCPSISSVGPSTSSVGPSTSSVGPSTSSVGPSTSSVGTNSN
jgi:hypothetical protein